MFHFLGEILVAVTGEIRNRLLILGLVVAVINIQQFQYPGFPFVPVLFGEFFAHEEYQIAYTYLLSRFNSQLGCAKLLQKSEMRKDIVIELSYKGFS